MRRKGTTLFSSSSVVLGWIVVARRPSRRLGLWDEGRATATTRRRAGVRRTTARRGCCSMRHFEVLTLDSIFGDLKVRYFGTNEFWLAPKYPGSAMARLQGSFLKSDVDEGSVLLRWYCRLWSDFFNKVRAAWAPPGCTAGTWKLQGSRAIFGQSERSVGSAAERTK
jgi:hypothetical protein